MKRGTASPHAVRSKEVAGLMSRALLTPRLCARSPVYLLGVGVLGGGEGLRSMDG